MGLVRMGPPHALILALQAEFNTRFFFESGTFQGTTAAWAAEHFEQVITCELAESLYEQARQRHAAHASIDFRLADSRAVLREIAPTLQQPAIFWLDGHWSGGETYGAEDECPVLDELAAINTSPTAHVILIDDARLFLSPPPAPHQLANWPDLATLIEVLRARHPYYVVVLEDAVVAVPPAAQPMLAAYAQDIATRAWQAEGQRRAETAPQRGWRLMREALSTWRAHYAKQLKKRVGGS